MFYRFVGETLFCLRIALGLNIMAYFILSVTKKRLLLSLLNIPLILASGLIVIIQSTDWFSKLNIGWRYVFTLSWYLIFAALIFALIFLYTKGTRNKYLFCFMVSFFLECASYGISLMVVDLGGINNFCNNITDVLVNILVVAATYALMWYLIFRKKKRNVTISIEASVVLSVYFIAIIVLLIYIRYSIQYIRHYVMGDGIYSFLLSLLLVLIPIIFILLMMREVRFEEKNVELTSLNAIWKEKEKQYNLLKENIDIINRKCHDMKRTIAALKATGGADVSVLDEMEQSVAVYDSIAKTGNVIIDTALSEKMLYCKQNNIDLSYMVDGTLFDFITKIDLYVLIDNILSNAVEAVEKLIDDENRVITLSAVKKDSFLCIQEINYYSGEKIDPFNITTSKKDKNYHGFGMASIRHIVDKYGGQISINTENNIFVLTIMFVIN